MRLYAGRRWHPLRGAAAVLCLVALAGCSGSGQRTDTAKTCTPLPASDVPPIAKALTQSDTGTYCASRGTSVLIVLKAASPDTSQAWTSPQVSGPGSGSRWISVPLTALRGTTVAGIEFNVAGSYRLTSTAPGRTWQAIIDVR